MVFLACSNQWNGNLKLNPTQKDYIQWYLYNPVTPCPTNGGKNLGDSSYEDGSPIGQGITDQRGINGWKPENNLPDITQRNDVISFVSDTLTSGYEFVGKINAKLYVQSNCSDTDFVVKLIDVFPDGREMLLNDGIVRACRMNGWDTTTWMSEGVTYALDVDLWSRAWKFQPGHKIKVLVTSSNFPKSQRNPNKAQNIIPLFFSDWSSYNIANNSILLSPDYPSYIKLPITSGYLTPPVIGPNTPELNAISPNPSTTGDIDLSWSSETGATGYKLYRDLSYITESSVDSLSPIYTGASTSYDDDGLVDGKYYYAVVAYNGDGESPVSYCKSVNVELESTNPPAKPVLDSISPNPSTTGDIWITWDPVAEADTYQLYRDTADITTGTVGELSPIYDGISVSYYDEDLTNDRYYYVLIANNEGGDSDLSDNEWVDVEIPSPPSKPNLHTIDPSISTTGEVELEWDAIVEADGYRLYRDTNTITSESISSLSPIYTGSDLTYNDTNLSEDTYYYALIAYNDGGDSILSDCRSVVVDLPAPPETPVLTEIDPHSSTSGNATLSWSSIDDATGYKLFRHTNEINETSITSLTPIYTGNNIAYEDNDLENGYYQYAVVAYNGDGDSGISNNDYLIVRIPDNPTSPALFLKGVAPGTNGQVSLEWSKPSKATQFKLYRSQQEINYTNIDDLDPIYNGESTAYTDDNVEDGDYYYSVVATNDGGYSAPSDNRFVTVKNENGGLGNYLPYIIAGIVAAAALAIGFTYKIYQNKNRMDNLKHIISNYELEEDIEEKDTNEKLSDDELVDGEKLKKEDGKKSDGQGQDEEEENKSIGEEVKDSIDGLENELKERPENALETEGPQDGFFEDEDDWDFNA
ncbi:MAG: CocE/NonD family hydrolase [Candidatus Lokiarchaeota archaeon]|nr:CocE/NonD family hydrolase [Candidatus Lokiarchaeota archaeon]